MPPVPAMPTSLSTTKVITLGPLQIRFHWVVALFVVALMSVLIRLGIWQLDRAAEKNAGRDANLAVQAQQAQPIEALFDGSLGAKTDDLSTVNLLLRGSYLNEKAIWLVNQTYEDQIGYEVLVPFRLQSNGKIILVSRGWVTARAFDRPKDYVPDINGEITITGLLQTQAATPEQKNKIDTAHKPVRIAHVDIQAISQLLDTSVFPYVIRLNADQAGTLIRHWKVVAINTDQHYSYALQWFAMAIAVLIVSLYLSSNLASLLTYKRDKDQPERTHTESTR